MRTCSQALSMNRRSGKSKSKNNNINAGMSALHPCFCFLFDCFATSHETAPLFFHCLPYISYIAMQHSYYYFHLMAIFPGEPGSPGSPLHPPAAPVLEENILDWWNGFITDWMSFLLPDCQSEKRSRSPKH